PLQSILDDFDVLPFSSLQTHSVRRRDVQTETHVEKLLSFNALQRNFRLYLRTNNEIFTEDFRAVVEDEDGQMRSYQVNRHNYFTGHVIGEENSRVQAHIDDNEFSAHILTDEAEYNIEVKNNEIKFLQHVHFYPLLGKPVLRGKRQVHDHKKNTCPMLLVADHRFYKHMGREEESTTINYLIELIDRVDDIYRNTSWDEEFSGYGVQIQQVRRSPACIALRMISRDQSVKTMDIAQNASSVCLAHLFTYQDFDEGTLGLAYVASNKPDFPGGLCSKPCPSTANNHGAIYLNTGLTSTKNYGKTILTKEADLVTTHELGHNFGAEHDPDNVPYCAPRVDQGGKYVMYPIAVSGDHLFSNCSKRSIVKRLRSKAASCFKERNVNVCGNSRVEQGEECDPGLLHFNSDSCCTQECRLRDGAQCRSESLQLDARFGVHPWSSQLNHRLFVQ
ncbi:hypothetical protein GOODEAATRI_018784, partial [Goodea atripinnis]